MPLTEKVSGDLKERIVSGDFGAGAKLPREKDLVEIYGVSRTVVREALALLRAEGVIEIRHGVGAFVRAIPMPDQETGFLPDDLRKRSDILELFELRKGVEIEAAGLAALRRSPAQEARIHEAFEAFCEALQEGADTSERDLDLHRAITEATNNRFYMDFLGYISQNAIVRISGSIYGGTQSKQLDREINLRNEHRLIVEAISKQDPQTARDAMRAHLMASEERFRALAMLDAGAG